MTQALTKRFCVAVATLFAAVLIGISPAIAQVQSVDPNTALSQGGKTPSTGPVDTADAALQSDLAPVDGAVNSAVPPVTGAAGTPTGYPKDDLIGAAEGVFGKGAKGLGDIIEKILKDQGQPNAYIAGREVSGALVVGLRYGSGKLTHNVEGQRTVYWTGPSVGFDIGGDATNTFVLVYNLYDSQDLYRRYPQVEGRAYFVGGFSATYLRRGNIVLIPVRLGVGVRLGANIGYMKFSEKSKWLPF